MIIKNSRFPSIGKIHGKNKNFETLESWLTEENVFIFKKEMKF